jgi:TonB family protein
MDRRPKLLARVAIIAAVLGCAAKVGPPAHLAEQAETSANQPERFADAQAGDATVEPPEDEHPLDRLVTQILAAAEAGDLEALGALMGEDFDVSIGGDSGRDAAIAALAEHRSRHLGNLVALLRGDCAFVDGPNHWMCPRELAETTTTEYGDALRTHFVLHHGTWHWEAYIVDDATDLVPRLGDRVLASSSPQIESPASVRDDPDPVRRIVRRQLHEVRRCYTEGLKHNPKLRGRVTIRFTIGPRGNVMASTVLAERTSLPDKRVAQCVVDAVMRWKFPEPQGGSKVFVTYPFVFEPG